MTEILDLWLVGKTEPETDNTGMSTTQSTIQVCHAFRHMPGRGTVGCGYYVTDADKNVLAGPYTNKHDAWQKADSLTAEKAA